MRITSVAQSMALGILLIAAPAVSSAQIGIGVSIRIGPPALPVYAQPPCPIDGYLWTPGYWAYGPDGYYWVPGAWVAPPRVGVLWTPGYWGFAGGLYGWHPGYWGPHIGFYGGVNYGFGYTGVGFVGGAWAGNVFRYNTAVVNVNTTVVRNVYVDRTVINNTTVINRASFNGPGGVNARPTPEQQAASREPHIQATPTQVSHEQASQNRRSFASGNNGRGFGNAAREQARPNAMAERPNAVNPPRSAPAEAHNAPARERPQQAPHERPAAERPHPAKEGHEKF